MNYELQMALGPPNDTASVLSRYGSVLMAFEGRKSASNRGKDGQYTDTLCGKYRGRELPPKTASVRAMNSI
uniref:Peptidylprolyl isomerase n=1 Tax=Heterorhabditis bacteriophora TaxID=37862 RepID=A0A1I7X3B3_HETBA